MNFPSGYFILALEICTRINESSLEKLLCNQNELSMLQLTIETSIGPQNDCKEILFKMVAQVWELKSWKSHNSRGKPKVLAFLFILLGAILVWKSSDQNGLNLVPASLA